VASSGPTPQAARAALDEALRLFVATAKDCGDLEDVLEEAGYVKTPSGWSSPTFIGVERQALAV
jgi:hypothetical protein